MKHTIPTNDELNAFAHQYVEMNRQTRRALDDTNIFGLVNYTIKAVMSERAGDDAFLSEIIALTVLESLKAEGWFDKKSCCPEMSCMR